MPAINFATLTAFMTWFGGIGYLMSSYSKLVAVAVVVLAGLGGLAGAGIIFVFMAKVLAPDQIPLDPADYYMPGTLGRVTVTIPEHGTGEIVYTQAGTRKTVAARAADGAGIPKGTEVVVLRYERGIVYARPWEHVAGERQGRGDA
jgi:membrane protein implicated in regulation of membrane protease activity